MLLRPTAARTASNVASTPSAPRPVEASPYPKRCFDTAMVNQKDPHVLAAARFHTVDFVVTNDAQLCRR